MKNIKLAMQKALESDYWSTVHKVLRKARKFLEKNPELFPTIKCDLCGSEVKPKAVYYPVGKTIHGCVDYTCRNECAEHPFAHLVDSIELYRKGFK